MYLFIHLTYTSFPRDNVLFHYLVRWQQRSVRPSPCHCGVLVRPDCKANYRLSTRPVGCLVYMNGTGWLYTLFIWHSLIRKSGYVISWKHCINISLNFPVNIRFSLPLHLVASQLSRMSNSQYISSIFSGKITVYLLYMHMAFYGGDII